MATVSASPSTKITGGSFLLEQRTPNEVFTPEDFSEQHQMIGQTTEEFAVNEIVPAWSEEEGAVRSTAAGGTRPGGTRM